MLATSYDAFKLRKQECIMRSMTRRAPSISTYSGRACEGLQGGVGEHEGGLVRRGGNGREAERHRGTGGERPPRYFARANRAAPVARD